VLRRLDDWMRPTQGDGTALGSRRYRQFDIRPPLWVRAAGLVGALPYLVYVLLRDHAALWLWTAAAALLVYIAAVVVWERRHRVERRVRSAWPESSPPPQRPD
jgi:hypothetical protein